MAVFEALYQSCINVKEEKLSRQSPASLVFSSHLAFIAKRYSSRNKKLRPIYQEIDTHFSDVRKLVIAFIVKAYIFGITIP